MPESNRRTRIWSPLHYHCANPHWRPWRSLGLHDHHPSAEREVCARCSRRSPAIVQTRPWIFSPIIDGKLHAQPQPAGSDRREIGRRIRRPPPDAISCPASTTRTLCKGGDPISRRIRFQRSAGRCTNADAGDITGQDESPVTCSATNRRGMEQAPGNTKAGLRGSPRNARYA